MRVSATPGQRTPWACGPRTPPSGSRRCCALGPTPSTARVCSPSACRARRLRPGRSCLGDLDEVVPDAVEHRPAFSVRFAGKHQVLDVVGLGRRRSCSCCTRRFQYRPPVLRNGHTCRRAPRRVHACCRAARAAACNRGAAAHRVGAARCREFDHHPLGLDSPRSGRQRALPRRVPGLRAARRCVDRQRARGRRAGLHVVREPAARGDRSHLVGIYLFHWPIFLWLDAERPGWISGRCSHSVSP